MFIVVVDLRNADRFYVWFMSLNLNAVFKKRMIIFNLNN